MSRLLFAFMLCLSTILFAGRPSPKGTLVIVGGGGEPQAILDAFYKASGGPGGVVGVVTTATEDPEGALKEWQDDLDKVGLTLIPINVRSREQASLPDLLEKAQRCTGFWFTGGDQNRVGDQVVGTPLHALIKARYEAGACIGGTSAGAAIMSKVMLTGDDRLGKEALSEFGPGAYRTREGMGFLPERVIVDQHFLRRGRENRLFSLIMDHPDYLGLGIDESTALVVKDGRAVVVGDRSVMVFDPSRLSVNGSSFRNLQIHVLRAGQSIDLVSRKVSPK
jgi:cyanophycinase